jgi:hypothetical protein
MVRKFAAGMALAAGLVSKAQRAQPPRQYKRAIGANRRCLTRARRR